MKFRSIFIFFLAFFGLIIQAAPSPADAGLPDGAAGTYLSAKIAALRGRQGDAVRFIERVWRDDDQNIDILRQLVLLKIAVGDIKEAFALAKKMQLLSKNDPLISLLLGIEAIGRDDHHAARKYFSPARQGKNRVYKQWPATAMLDVWVSFRLGGAKAAIEKLDHLLRLYPNLRVLAVFQKALIYDLAAKPNLARQSYEKAVRLQRGVFGRTGRAYGLFLERSGSKKRARQVYKDFVKIGGIDRVIGDEGLKRLAAGKKPQKLVRRVNDGAAEILLYYSTLAFLGQRMDEAVFYAQLALFMRDSLEDAQLRLAEIFEEKKDHRKAIEIYRRIAPRSSYALITGIRIALAYEKSGMKDLAESQLFALARRYKKRALPLTALGQIYQLRRDYVKSADIYSKALERVSALDVPWLIYYSRGIAFERSGQWSRAERDLQRALVLSENNPEVMNYLGYSWVDRGYHLGRALKMLKRAALERPNSEHIVDSLGWAYYRLGMFDKAVDYLERAVQIGPADPVINDHLGDALWQTGRRVEARYQWQRVLKLEAAPEIDIKDIKRKLEEGLAKPKRLPSKTRL